MRFPSEIEVNQSPLQYISYYDNLFKVILMGEGMVEEYNIINYSGTVKLISILENSRTPLSTWYFARLSLRLRGNPHEVDKCVSISSGEIEIDVPITAEQYKYLKDQEKTSDAKFPRLTLTPGDLELKFE